MSTLKRILITLSVLALNTLNGHAQTAPVIITYDGEITVKKMQANMPYISNRKYVMEKIPADMRLMDMTILPGGAYKPIGALIPKGTLVYICIDSGINPEEGAEGVREYAQKLRDEGWGNAGRIPTTDLRMEYLRVFKKQFHNEATVVFEGVGFPGVMIVAPSLKIGE